MQNSSVEVEMFCYTGTHSNMSPAFNPEAWAAFFTAEAGGSAALAGLIFVAVSINLAQIVGQRNLVARSAKAIYTLTGVLLASTFCLVPAQRPAVLAWEMTLLGAILWLATTVSQWGASHKNSFVLPHQRVIHFILTQLSSVPCLRGGRVSAGRVGRRALLGCGWNDLLFCCRAHGCLGSAD